MATNNAVNITSAGIPIYDGAGTFTAISIPVNVASGGQGNSSLTAYAVLCGGTSTTNPVQSIASVGTAGQALTSNGAGMLPTFQDVSAGFTGYVYSWAVDDISTLADSSTYYCGIKGIFSTSQDLATRKFLISTAGTITRVYGAFVINGTLASSENTELYIRVNNTTDATITTTAQLTSATTTFNNASMSQVVSAGDYIQLKVVTPAFATNPTQVGLAASVLITL